MKNSYLPVIMIRIFSLRFIILPAIILLYSSCSQDNKNSETSSSVPKIKQLISPEFNADSAYQFIEEQIRFGPRVPNTPSHNLCANYISGKLQSYTKNVIIQSAEVKAFNGTTLHIKNIIASFAGKNNKKILLCAHWDSRPFADQDTTNQDKPIDGANDGASGVAVLLETARLITESQPLVSIDIVFFDAEDYGQPEDNSQYSLPDTWCLGSQYWSKNLQTKNNYSYGILLDMVGAAHATFTIEANSSKFAPSLSITVWETAAQLGYSNYFKFDKTKAIIDDHVYINNLAGIPCIDIIHFDKSTESNFFKEWHTHGDNLSVIDKNTLKAVGQTLLVVIFAE